jgi:hypothetical protein
VTLGADAPSYAKFHAGWAPVNTLVDPDNHAVKVVAAMDPPSAAGVLAVYLRDGSAEKIALYTKIISSVPRAHAGKIVDALPADVQVKGITVLEGPRQLEILFYVSEETYGKIAGQSTELAEVFPVAKAPPSDPAALAAAAGTYVLDNVDGKPVPYETAPGWFLKSASWTLAADGSYTMASVITHTADSANNGDGRYAVKGGKIELHRGSGPGEDLTTGTLTATNLAITVGGKVYNYKKQ